MLYYAQGDPGENAGMVSHPAESSGRIPGPGKRGEKMTDEIDWERFRSDYVKLETGVEKILKLTNWRQGAWFNAPGIRFDVLEEDSEPVTKVFTVTSKRLIRALKPIILKAEDQGRDIICVSILRIGEGLNTHYEARNV